MFMRNRVLSWFVVFVMLFGIMIGTVPSTADTSAHTPHSIPAGSSWAGNPLKGFVPFDHSTTSFPHSMEWCYLPVRDVMTGMNSFNWTALDNRLNAISGRGHQAVFRFYLDYPTMPTGVPQFLIDGGLTMRSYSEFGGGLCPDYNNANLRNAMKNLIAALGARYDGDPRIGFITAGILGFWGEWHTWPYDSDTSDGKPNWEPSDTVKNEILTAFDNAFNKTPVLLRYPAGNAPNMNFGYHDDSFCWETLNTNSWNFVPRLISAGVQNKWRTQPIGGELRPEIQDTIFESTPWIGGNGERWDDCVNATHVTWLLNEAIKRYSYGSTEYNNAVTASKQMGYDFRVTTAYFDNISSNSPLYLGIDIKNIGIAPFYYDNTLWPVKVGVKQNGVLKASWTTPWNLKNIEANGQTYTFEYSTPGACGLANGTYTMCIKVENPLPNGNKLGFANEGQNSDGWLELGTFTVGGGGGGGGGGGSTSYEAEASNNTLAGGAVVANSSNCSGGKKVGYIGNNSGTLQFNGVSASSAGSYTMTVHYLTAETRNMYISVNGGTATNVSFGSSGGWDTVGTKDVTINLNAGNNTIKFSNPSGWAPDIDKITINTSGGGGGDTQAPTAPSNLRSTGKTSSSVSLAWNASSDNVGVTGYDVYRNGTYVTSVTGTTATVSGLSPNTTYTFTVKAKDAAGNYSPASNSLNVTTDPAGSTGLLLDNFDGSPSWPGMNDLGLWAGANSFVNNSGVISSGALVLQYNNNGWFGSDVNQDISAYTKMVIRIRGASGGEQNHFRMRLGGVEKTFAQFSGNTITTSYKDIVIDLVANGVNRTSPGQLNFTFWHGYSGTIYIDEIRFE